MKLSHNETKELLPEFQRAVLDDDKMAEVKRHLSACEDCLAELTILKGLSVHEVPDPGDLFWKTLPQKIRVISAEEGRPGFFRKYFSLRFMPLAPVLLLVMLAVAVIPLLDKKDLQHDPLFSDPLDYSLLEYGDISEKQVWPVRASLSVEEAELLQPADSTYHREFVSLSSDELGRLNKTLSEKGQRGG